MKLTSEQDAFGHTVLDRYRGRGGFEILERSDGYFSISSGPGEYLAEPTFWAQGTGWRVVDRQHAPGVRTLYTAVLERAD